MKHRLTVSILFSAWFFQAELTYANTDESKEAFLYPTSTNLFNQAKAALDTIHSVTIKLLKSPCSLLFALPKLSVAQNHDPAAICTNHIWLKGQEPDLSRAFSACHTRACTEVRSRYPAGCLYMGTDTGFINCVHTCEENRRSASQDFYTTNYGLCTYKACSNIAVPQHQIICAKVLDTINANRCFDQRFCQKRSKSKCNADKKLGFWESLTGKTYCDNTLCPGRFVLKRHTSKAKHIKRKCILRNCPSGPRKH